MTIWDCINAELQRMHNWVHPAAAWGASDKQPQLPARQRAELFRQLKHLQSSLMDAACIDRSER